MLIGDRHLRAHREAAAAPPGPTARRAIIFALLTGAIIASYTLWDKHAVSGLGIPPLLLNWSLGLGRLLTPDPSFSRKHGVVRDRLARLPPRGLGRRDPQPTLLHPGPDGAAFTPVSYVAPAREIGILLGVIFGARLLAEGHARRRIIAGGAMVLGVVALAFG